MGRFQPTCTAEIPACSCWKCSGREHSILLLKNISQENSPKEIRSLFQVTHQTANPAQIIYRIANTELGVFEPMTMPTLTFPHMHGSVLRPKLLFAVKLLGHKLWASLDQTEKMSVLQMPLCSPSHTVGEMSSMPSLLVIKVHVLAYAVWPSTCVCVRARRGQLDGIPNSSTGHPYTKCNTDTERVPAAKACCTSIRQEPACGQGQREEYQEIKRSYSYHTQSPMTFDSSKNYTANFSVE